jgi:hypothetical protein
MQYSVAVKNTSLLEFLTAFLHLIINHSLVMHVSTLNSSHCHKDVPGRSSFNVGEGVGVGAVAVSDDDRIIWPLIMVMLTERHNLQVLMTDTYSK